MSVYSKLAFVQSNLNCPKNQYNSFGKYNYRSCEDILEGLKKPLSMIKGAVTISDEIILIGERYYVKATATFIDTESGETITNYAYARECDDKKGMDASQVTGATSSYARKYALNGLFALDDNKDADTNEKAIETKAKQEMTTEEKRKAEKIKQKVEEVIKYATPNQISYISENFDFEVLDKLIKVYKVNSISELTEAQAQQVINKRERQLKEATENANN